MTDQKQTAKEENGYYWVPKTMICNGCKFLNFARQGCRRNLPPGQVRPLITYRNGDGYLAMLKPSDCNYSKDKTRKNPDNLQQTGTSQGHSSNGDAA